MAERRMFSKSVVETDLFYDMPSSAQALYFHLGMNADDDGFLSNARSIQATMGSKPDDIKILLAKNFVIPVSDGLVVITHWLVNNRLRADRYHETAHTEAKSLLQIEPGKPYRIRENCSGIPLGIPSGNQTGAKRDTQYSIGKDSIDNNIVHPTSGRTIPSPSDEIPPSASSPLQGEAPASPAFTSRMYQQTEESQPRKNQDTKHRKASDTDPAFCSFWREYPRHDGKQAAFAAFRRLNPSAVLLSTILEDVKRKKQSDQWLSEKGKFIPQASKYLRQERWTDEGVILPDTPKNGQKNAVPQNVLDREKQLLAELGVKITR